LKHQRSLNNVKKGKKLRESEEDKHDKRRKEKFRNVGYAICLEKTFLRIEIILNEESC